MNIKLLYPGLRFKIIIENKIIIATIHKIYKQSIYLDRNEIWIKFKVKGAVVYTICNPKWIEPQNIIGAEKYLALGWYYFLKLFGKLKPMTITAPANLLNPNT